VTALSLPARPRVHLHDFDGAAYDGDVGTLAAAHPESDALGFADRDEFGALVDAIRDGGGVPGWPDDYDYDAVERGSEFAAILEREATVGLAEVARIVNEAQDAARVKEGYRALVADLVAAGADVCVVTAGPVAGPDADVRLGAGHLVESVFPTDAHTHVVGSELVDDPRGGVRVERFCGRGEKVDRIEDALGGPLSEWHAFAVGDSATDADLLAVATQSWAVGDGLRDHATIDAAVDRDYHAVAVTGTVADELHRGGPLAERREDAVARGAGVAERDWTLPPLESTAVGDAVTDAVLSVYDDVRG
jgi:phosphoserine phosphatase